MNWMRHARVPYETITYTFRVLRKELSLQRWLHLTNKRCTAQVINGTEIARQIQNEVKKDVDRFAARNIRPPQLSVILVGDDYVSNLYIQRKMIAAESLGITSKTLFLDKTTRQSELVDLIRSLNESDEVDGILVQLPLPDHIQERVVCNTISPQKDVDGFNAINVGLFCLNMHAMIPCTALGVQELIRQTGVETKGKHAVVCGRSKNVSMPIAMLLQSSARGETNGLDATTTICHRFTPPDVLKKLTLSADIIISAAGVPKLITADMVKKGALVIDVGITRCFEKTSEKYSLHGDVDFKGVKEVAGFITPVPGGVGPMTVAMLMKNTLKAAKALRGMH